MSNYLDLRIAERRKRINDLDQERLIVQAELRAYEDAKANAGGIVVPATQPRPAASASGLAVVSAGNTRPAGDPYGKMSENWRRTLAGLKGVPTFGAKEVFAAAQAIGYHPALHTIRAQLHWLSQKGRMERVSDGVYRFTGSPPDVRPDERPLPSLADMIGETPETEAAATSNEDAAASN